MTVRTGLIWSSVTLGNTRLGLIAEGGTAGPPTVSSPRVDGGGRWRRAAAARDGSQRMIRALQDVVGFAGLPAAVRWA
jgi:hypothetical protein